MLWIKADLQEYDVRIQGKLGERHRTSVVEIESWVELDGLICCKWGILVPKVGVLSKHRQRRKVPYTNVHHQLPI